METRKDSIYSYQQKIDILYRKEGNDGKIKLSLIFQIHIHQAKAPRIFLFKLISLYL